MRFSCFKISLLALVFGLGQLYCAQNAVAKSRQNTPYQEFAYQQKVLKRLEIQKYKRELLPFSGLMTVQEYENQSRAISNSDKKIPEPKLPKDIKMQYVPQPVYKLVRYNNPPGSVDINIKRKFKFNRQINAPGVASPDKKRYVYPAIYYYAENVCVTGDLFLIPLDTTLPDVDRILRANVLAKNPVPILSTDKNISEKFVFRTLTPIDFSSDGKIILAKEKIGYEGDGIWQTNLWVYDFESQSSKKLVEVRDAIKYYWQNAKNINLDDKRWDIYPLGFDAQNPDRIIVEAFGYTGNLPKFLGIWSVDYKGDRTQLVSLFEKSVAVSSNGFKVVEDGIVNPMVLKKTQKEQDKIVKQKRKAEKKALKKIKKDKKKALKAKLKEMDREFKQVKKDYKSEQRIKAPTSTPALIQDLEETSTQETPEAQYLQN